MNNNIENILDKRFEVNQKRNPILFINDNLRPAIKKSVLLIVSEYIDHGLLLESNLIQINDICLSGIGISNYYNPDDDIEISIFASIKIDQKVDDVLNNIISQIPYIPYLYKKPNINFFNKNVSVKVYHNYSESNSAELYSVLKNQWIRKQEADVLNSIKDKIIYEYLNVEKLTLSLIEKYKFLPKNYYNLKELEKFYIQYLKNHNNSENLLKVSILEDVYSKTNLANQLKDFIIEYNAEYFSSVADDYFIKDEALKISLHKYYNQKESKQNKVYNSEDELIDDLDNIVKEKITPNETDCDLLFENGKLRTSVKNVLKLYVDDIIDGLEIDKSIIKDVYIVSSIVGRFYNDYSDIDINIVLDFDEYEINGYKNLTNCIKHKNKLGFQKKYYIFDKSFDYTVIANDSACFSNNIYSLNEDKWLIRANVSNYKYNKDLIVSEIKDINESTKRLVESFEDVGLNEKSYYNCIDIFSSLYTSTTIYDLFYNKEVKNYEKSNIKIVEKILHKHFNRRSPFINLNEIYNSLLNKKFEKIISNDSYLCSVFNVKFDALNLTPIDYLNKSNEIIRNLSLNKNLSILFFDNKFKMHSNVRNHLVKVIEYWATTFRKDLESLFEVSDICLEGDYASYCYDDDSVINITIYVDTVDYLEISEDYLNGLIYGLKNRIALFNKPIDIKVRKKGSDISGNSYSVYKNQWIKNIDFNVVDRGKIFEIIKSKIVCIDDLLIKTSIQNYDDNIFNEIWGLLRNFYAEKFISPEAEIASLICDKLNLIDKIKDIFYDYQYKKTRFLFNKNINKKYSICKNHQIIDQLITFKKKNKDLDNTLDVLISDFQKNEYQFKDKRNPMFFDKDEKLIDEVKNYFIEVAKDFYKYSPFDSNKIKIEDICLCSSQASKYYKNTSDIDLHVYLNFDDVKFNEKWNIIACSFSNVHYSRYFKGYKFFGKNIDVTLVTDINKNISTNSYSILNNKWNKKTEKSDFNIDLSKIKSEVQIVINSYNDGKNKFKSKEINYDDLYSLISLKSNMLGAKYLYVDNNHIKQDYETSNDRLKFKLLRFSGPLVDANDFILERVFKCFRQEEIKNILNSVDYLEKTYNKTNSDVSTTFDKKLNNDFNYEIFENSKKIVSYIKEYISLYTQNSFDVNDVYIVGDFATKYYDESSQLDLYVDIEYKRFSRFGIFRISYMLQILNFISKFSKYKILGKNINLYFNNEILKTENIYSLKKDKWIKCESGYKSNLNRKIIYNLSPIPLNVKNQLIENLVSKVNDLKPFRNPILFEEDNLIYEVSNKLKNIGLESFEKLKEKLDFIELSDLTISGSLAGITYNNNSDLDIHVVLKMQNFSRAEITKFIKEFNDKTDSYNLLGKKIDIVFKFDVQKNYSANEYSLINNKWITKSEKEEYNYSASNIIKMLNDKILEFENLKKKENLTIKDLVKFRNSIIITDQLYISEKLSTNKSIDLTDYKKYFSILKKIGFIFEVEDEISNILNKKYFS